MKNKHRKQDEISMKIKLQSLFLSFTLFGEGVGMASKDIISFTSPIIYWESGWDGVKVNFLTSPFIYWAIHY